jgi:long-chain fatty acid transport protein
MKSPYLVFVFGLALTIGTPLDSLASGFSRTDAASPYLATAGAGQATDTSVSAAFNNPAGLVGVRSIDLYSGAILAYESFTFYDDGSEGISPGFDNLRRDNVDYGAGLTGGPTLYFAMPLNQKLSFGFALMSPFGGSSDFGEDWVGSHFAETAEVFSVQASASLGYQLTETISIGVALGAQYLSWELNMDLPPAPFGPVNPGHITPDHPMYSELLPPGSEELIKIDDVQPYMSIGALWQPTENTRVGFRYIPEINHELQGNAQIFAPIPELTAVRDFNANMQFNTPSITTLSLSHQFTPRLALLADVEHSGWSAFMENRLVHENGPTVVVERDWQDTLGYSLGINYQTSERTMLKFGVGYDESPIAENDLKIDPPIDRQIAYSLGFESQLTQQIGLFLTYQYLDMGDIRVNQMLFPGQVIRGYSDASVHALQAAITVSFE